MFLQALDRIPAEKPVEILFFLCFTILCLYRFNEGGKQVLVKRARP
jgi:hypothetical protein